MRRSNRRHVTLGELIDSKAASLQTGPFGSQLHASDYVPRGIPVIPTEAIGRRTIGNSTLPQVSEDTVARLSRHVLRVGDILFARRGVQATGLSAIVTDRYAGALCGTGGIRLRLSGADLDPQFLSFWLSARRSIEWIKAHAVGGVMPNVNESVLRLLPIQFPEIGEQCAITTFLSAIDEKIELNSEVNRKLEQLANALFRSWFVDFDPVSAKRDGRSPVGVPAEAIDLFPTHFDESELGPIPQGWRWVSLSELAELNARTLSAKNLPSAIHYIEISDVHRGDVQRITTYPRGAEPSRARRALRHGDTVVSAVRPERGAYFLCLDPSEDLVASTGFVVLTPRPKRWALVYCAATSDDALDHYERRAEGGAYPAMRPDAVAAFRVGLPVAPSLCDVFCSVAEPLLQQAHANRAEIHTLAELRDTLLGPLLSGELTIKSAEQVAGAAL